MAAAHAHNSSCSRSLCLCVCGCVCACVRRRTAGKTDFFTVCRVCLHLPSQSRTTQTRTRARARMPYNALVQVAGCRGRHRVRERACEYAHHSDLWKSVKVVLGLKSCVGSAGGNDGAPLRSYVLCAVRCRNTRDAPVHYTGRRI